MTTTSSPPIHFNNVRKSFGDDLVLSNVSCEFMPNQVTAIVGKSGCGKSTLLKLINGLEKPSSGTVSIFGTPINYHKLEQLRRQIGYSIQGTGLFPHLTVRQNICLLAEVIGWQQAKIDKRLTQLTQLVSLEQSLINRYPFELSGGQQQRAGLCRAMMLDPDVLLFDEAFAAVDPMTRNDIHQQIIKLQELNPRTIIMVTHDLPEAFRLADRIVIVHNQKIVSHEPKEHFLSKAEQSRQTTHAQLMGDHLEFNESILQWLS